ncbi:HAD family hydrolase [Candidatus Magnetomoraceae bacterium gMMP-15]
MYNIEIVIFDCDGVMFDTKETNRIYYNSILNHCGLPDMNKEQLTYVHANTVDKSLLYLFGRNSLLKKAHDYRNQIDYKNFIKYMKLEPTLKPLLTYLRPAYKIAIATNRSDTMPIVMKKFDLNGYFDMVVTSLDVENPKPGPDQLLAILENFKLNPQDAIYIGDSQVDEIAAKRSDIPLIAYKNPSLNAAFHINSLQEIRDILNNL